jgi:hypothetical protein
LLVSRNTIICIYKTIAKPVLSYGSEARTIRRTEEKRLISAEMRFLRKTVGYTRWDHKRKEDILTELQITEFIYQSRKNCKEHVDRMISDRIPKMILNHQPKEKINLGRPLKRWKDSVL